MQEHNTTTTPKPPNTLPCGEIGSRQEISVQVPQVVRIHSTISGRHARGVIRPQAITLATALPMAATVKVKAPMPAMISQFCCEEGKQVHKGETIVIISAMKMEHNVIAPVSGVVHKVAVKKNGALVKKDEVLVEIKADSNQVEAKSASHNKPQIRIATTSAVGWENEIKELHDRQQRVKELGGKQSVARQHAAGKLTARERIALLVDRNSFREIGSTVAKVAYVTDENGAPTNKIESLTPANFVGGKAHVDTRAVMVGADDFTVRGGHADGGVFRKQVYIEQLARQFRIPMVRLIDGSSGGGSEVATMLNMHATYVPPLIGFEHIVPMLKEVPVASAVLGSVVGLGAARACASHFSVMVQSISVVEMCKVHVCLTKKDISQVFVAGPPVVAYATHEIVTKDELGGAVVCTSNGTIDNIATTEAEAFDQIKIFLSFLPSNSNELPPRKPTTDSCSRSEQGLLSIIPKDRHQQYDIREVIRLIVDKADSSQDQPFFEIGRNWGRSVVCGFSRLTGYSVGIVASDCMMDGGSLTADAADKLQRFISLCDTFLDQPGFAIGTEAEKAGTIRRGVNVITALYQSVVPWFSVIIRRCYGVAGAALVDRGSPNFRVAWPSGDWGSLPVEGGLEAAYKRLLQDAGSEEAAQTLKDQLKQKYEVIRSPFRTAELFIIEEIIDPRTTRSWACEWIELAYLKHSRPYQTRPLFLSPNSRPGEIPTPGAVGVHQANSLHLGFPPVFLAHMPLIGSRCVAILNPGVESPRRA